MRIVYPEDMINELRSLEAYLVFNGKENVVSDNAPEGIRERYDAVRMKMREFEKEHVGF